MSTHIDCIIVGGGFAGTFLAHQCLKNNTSFLLLDKGTQSASQVAAGVFNPVVLKRFTPVWNAQAQIEYLYQSFDYYEKLMGKKFLLNTPVERIFANEEEKKTWITKSTRKELKPYLMPINNTSSIPSLHIPIGKAGVKHSGRIDSVGFLQSSSQLFLEKNALLQEELNYDALEVHQTYVEYKSYKATYIVFAEGIGITQNPYFSDLPIRPNKGECLHIKLENPIPEDFLLKKQFFLFPMSSNTYYVGGTYQPNDMQLERTLQKKEQLEKMVDQLCTVPYKISKHLTAIRPTTPDRRPVIGKHKDFSSLVVLNGLGTRGLMLGNYYANQLYQHLFNEGTLDSEVDCQRFYS